MKIGSHVSISGGLIGATKEAVSYGANTFMVYTGAPQNTKRQPIEKLKAKEGLAFMKEHNIDSFVVHAPYIINLASFKEEVFDFAVSFLSSEIKRTEALGSHYIILHPGTYTEKDLKFGIDRIALGLNQVFENTKECDVSVCLETMSGKGTEIGRTFYEISEIISKVKQNERLSVCFDTCHTHDFGYDIINDFDNVMKDFDNALGLSRLKVFHINGSLNERGSKKDRHANIGAKEDNVKGKDYIGFEALKNIVHSSYAKDCFIILETPWLNKKTNLYKEEIEKLKGVTK